MKLAIHPLTPERWDDFARLFGPNGACAGCWCMFFRLPRSEFDQKKGAGNRRMIRALVDRGPAPGLLAYDGDDAVGWCAVSPREELLRLRTSRVAAPIDEQPAWFISCLFIAASHRRRGVTRRLIEAAVAFAQEHGAKLVEACPIDAGKEVVPTFAYHGFASSFAQAGFTEAARRTPTRPLMRRTVRKKRRARS